MARERPYEQGRHPEDIFARARRFGEGGLSRPAPPAPPQVIKFPDSYAPPEDAQTFQREDHYDSAGNDTSRPANLIYTLPDDFVGVLVALSIYSSDTVAGDVIRWRLEVNDTRVPNWDDIRMYPAVAAFRSVAFEPRILLPEGAKISIFIENQAANAHRIGASYDGWQFLSRKRGGGSAPGLI